MGPIGIFDSGIGGLTVAKAIAEHLPNLDFIYFGDTKHLPYGDKSAESVRNYSVGIAKFLVEKGCEAIVIACNTASAQAVEKVQGAVPKNVPVFNVVDPIVKLMLEHHDGKKLGIIGTKGTIESGVYPTKIRAQNPNAQVVSMATPLLASMIEEGFFNSSISRSIIAEYLSDPQIQNIDVLALACTHYPLIKTDVEEFYKGKVAVIDNANVLANTLKEALGDMLKDKTTPGRYQFFVSDYTQSFAHSTRIFFGDDIDLQEYRLWD